MLGQERTQLCDILQCVKNEIGDITQWGVHADIMVLPAAPAQLLAGLPAGDTKIREGVSVLTHDGMMIDVNTPSRVYILQVPFDTPGLRKAPITDVIRYDPRYVRYRIALFPNNALTLLYHVTAIGHTQVVEPSNRAMHRTINLHTKEIVGSDVAYSYDWIVAVCERERVIRRVKRCIEPGTHVLIPLLESQDERIRH